MNRKAGVGRTERLAEYIFAKFASNSIPYELVEGNSADDVIQKVMNRISDFSSIVAVGGDGSVHTAAQIAYESGLPLGIIAAGSGDDVARVCGLPHGRNYEATKVSADHFVASYLVDDKTAVDSIRLRTADGKEHTVMAVMSAGFDSRVNANSAKMTYLKGTFRYIAALIKTLRSFKPIDYHWKFNGEEKKFQAMVVAIGNGSMFGGGMKVCPAAHIKDGEFDLLIVNKISVATLLRIFPRIFKGSHVMHPEVRELRGQKLWIDAPTEQVWGDGEYLGLTPMELEIKPDSIQVYGVRL
jgi:diacylglycerol kinase (ATP)